MTSETMVTQNWGTMEWLADGKTHAGLDLSLARMTVLPGKTSPAHRHPHCNDVIHILSGSIDVGRDNKWLPTQTGDTFIVKAGTTHQTRCTSPQKAILMVAYSAHTRIYEDVTP